MNVNDGIYTSEIKLPSEICKEIIDVYEKCTIENSNTIINSEKDYGGKLRRQDNALFLDETGSDTQEIVNQYLNEVVQEYTNMFNVLRRGAIGSEDFQYDYHLRSIRQKIQKTKIGGGYHLWHFEDSELQSSRVLAWTIYLNDVTEGGETEFLYHAKRITPKTGKICLFPANFLATHRGNPPLSNDKYIVTGWYNRA